MKRTTNIPFTEIQDSISKDLNENKQYYEKVQLRCVAVKRDGHWQNILSVVRAFPKLLIPPSSEDRKVSYADALLIEKWISLDEIIPILNEIAKNTFAYDQEVIDFGLTSETWVREQLPSANDYMTYPAEQYRITSSQQVYYSGDILLSYNSPVYPSIYNAIQEWCQLRGFHGHGDGRLGSIIIIMPQCKARIVNLASSTEAVTVSMKIEDNKLQGLRVKGSWSFSGQIESIDQPANGSSVIIERPSRETPDSIAFWLIGPDDRIFDFHRETRYWNMGQTRVLQFNSEKPEYIDVAMQAIKMGEGPTVEFKPYITIENQKSEELIKTVIAFANTLGGVLLIGVNNHCIVTGIEKDIAGKKKCQGGSTPEEVYNEYMGKLKQHIADALNDSIDMDLEKIVLEGHAVILLKVAEGSKKPYYEFRTDEIFVRRGSNNVRPNPDYELPQLYATKKNDDTAPF